MGISGVIQKFRNSKNVYVTVGSNVFFTVRVLRYAMGGGSNGFALRMPIFDRKVKVSAAGAFIALHRSTHVFRTFDE